MDVLHSDAAYMPIGTQFIANINFSATKKDDEFLKLLMYHGYAKLCKVQQ